jgi:hypothetical protein
MPLKILAVSDQVDPRIHSASLRARMPDIALVFGCGDVPARYLEFLADALDRPVYFVYGNHLEEVTRRGLMGKRFEPMGCIDIGGRVVRDPESGLLIAGIPGSPRYSRDDAQQYSENEVRWMLLRMAPRLLWNKLRYGRALDILVSHAPPRHINDREDVPHRGFRALRTFLRLVHPRYHLHGHIHLYNRNEDPETVFEGTRVVNVYPYRVLEIELDATQAALAPASHSEGATG